MAMSDLLHSYYITTACGCNHNQEDRDHQTVNLSLQYLTISRLVSVFDGINTVECFLVLPIEIIID